MTTDTLTDKQLEIVYLIYRFRFLNRIQIQQFLNHKDHSLIIRYLKELTDKQILNRIYSTTRANINTPSIYYLGTKSRLALKDHNKCNPDVLGRVYREKYRSDSFREHSMFIADLYFHFQKAAEQESSVCHFYTATDISTVAYAPLPLPDAYITITNGKKHIKRYFLDVFLDRMPMFAVRRRINQYCRYFNGNYWQDHNKDPFPKVLLICPSLRIQHSLLRSILQLLEVEDANISFFLGLKDDIKKRGIQSDTWETV